MNKRVYDCFTFFNELELLEVRLNELSDAVDYFVLVEATQTFQGKPKPLVYAENQARFARFHNRIIHVVVDDMPAADDPRVREHHQRRCIVRGISTAEPDDMIIVSDVDELLRISTINEIRSKSGYFLIDMPMFQFFLNTRAIPCGWNKVFAFSHRLLGELPDFSRIRVLQIPTFEKFSGRNHMIEDGGWHFTFLGGPQRVREKLASYSHTGNHYETMQHPKAIEQQILTGHQVGGHNITEIVDVDDTFPMYVQENIDHFVEIGYVKPVLARVRELEWMFRRSENQRRRLVADVRDLFGELEVAATTAQIGDVTKRYREKIDGAWKV